MHIPRLCKGIARMALGQQRYAGLQKRYWQTLSPRESQLHVPALCSPPEVQRHPSPYGFIVDGNNPLVELGAKYKPTKRLHNYLPYYWMHFRDIRAEVRSVCEIGVQTDKSIRMWEEFFPNATIYGIDIDPRCKSLEGGRCRIMIGDQSDVGFLKKFVAQVGQPLDIIIDDGSHLANHQLLTFDVLFPHLSDHGIYVVEDTGGVVGDYDLDTINSFKKLIDHVMYWPAGFNPAGWGGLASFPPTATWADRNLIGLAFYRWMVFIFKGRNPEDNPYLGKKRE